MKPRLVVFELHHLGDSVLALPFLNGARTRYQVTVCARKDVASFLRVACPGIELMEAPDSFAAQVSFVRKKIRLDREDISLCVWPDSRMHVLMRLTGAGTRIGMPMTATNYYAAHLPWRRHRILAGQILSLSAQLLLQGGPLLTRSVDRAGHDQPHREDWAQMAQALDFHVDEELPWIRGEHFSPPVTIRGFIRRVHEENRPLIVLHGGGRLPTKRWPYFSELLAQIALHDDPPILIVNPPGESAPESASPRQLTITAGNWSELFGIFQAASAIICNDSFASHLGAAFGKKVVSIFGSGNPDWFAPYKSENHVAATSVCPHRPCIDRCVMPSVVCLESVSVSMVETRLRNVLNKG